MANVAQKC